MRNNRILKNATTVMLFSLIAKLASFFVELFVASSLGVSKKTDAFYMVYGIVQIIYPMISVGIWKVFLPEYKTRNVLGNHNSANGLTNQLLTFFSMLSATFVLFLFIFPSVVIRVFAPGFNKDTISISEDLLRIVAFVMVFNTIATFSAVVLQTNEQFSKSQIKEVIVHIPTLIYLIVFRDNSSVYGLAYSIVVGAAASSVISYNFSKKYYKYSFPTRLFDYDVLAVLRRVPVTCLNSIINQLNSIIDKAFASALPSGAVTCLNYGNKLISLFDGIFSTAISTALFPYVTELVAKNESEKLEKFIKGYLFIICVILLPITAVMTIYSNEIVTIVYRHGRFDDNSVVTTARVLLMYGLGLVILCYTTIVNDIFFVLNRTNVLLITTIINIAMNIMLDYRFALIWGVAGLALATTIANSFVLFIKFYLIRDVFRIDKELVKLFCFTVVFCGISSVASLICKEYLRSSAPITLAYGLCLFLVVYSSLVFGLNKKMREIILSVVLVLKEKKMNE